MAVEDRRIRKTRTQLRQALAELILEKDLGEITVKELTERADVNRGTFYAHYQDLQDMVEQVEGELFQEFSVVLDGHEAAELRWDLTPILRDVFCFVKKNRSFCRALMTTPMGEDFFRRLSSTIYQKCLLEWEGLYRLGDMSGPNNCLEFVVAGTVGLVRAWALRDFREPPEEMAALANRLILSGLRSLEGKT